MKKPRPGGRTARNQAAVFDVAAALLTEKEPGSVAMTEIAERAGVAVTTLYRRWREVGSLLLEVAVGQLDREHPLPDTDLSVGICGFGRRRSPQRSEASEALLYSK